MKVRISATHATAQQQQEEQQPTAAAIVATPTQTDQIINLLTDIRSMLGQIIRMKEIKEERKKTGKLEKLCKRKGREEEQEKVGRYEEEKEGGQEEGGQEVDVMSKEKEKGGEEHEELSIMEEEGREASKKDVGQDMDTIMQTLDVLVENIVPPTAIAKMPPAGEKKRKVVKAISPSSLTRRVKEGRRTRSQSALFKDLEYEFDGRRKKKFAQYEVRRDYRGRKQLSTDEVRVIDNFLDTTRIDG
ncbi:hypothetical protein Taro_050391 [Colocasia esculenta]|uniref:Uncharacterized protein n=1 Tax=Colocasia esculenta TaxID=4460 RepID=A0A843XDB6_COLES|nr:hypothetical protein [Colocasia esculenta]